MIQRLRQMPLQHHQVDIARLIVCHEAFSKFAEGRVLNFFSRLPHQFEIKIEIMQRDQTQTKNLFRLDEVTDVAAREFPARGASAVFLDRSLVQRELRILQIDCAGSSKRSSVACKSR